jgi:hypothetical protein
MAAGLGYKEFSTGDILTAADANGYLASQVVMVFASAAARTSAIASPQEGMISYLKDTNSTEYYSGSAWVAIGGASSPNYTLINTGGTTLSGAGTVTISGISGKNDLYIFIAGVTGGDVNNYSNLIFRLNTDTGSNYEYVASSLVSQNTSGTSLVVANLQSASATSIDLGGHKTPATFGITIQGTNAAGVKPIQYVGSGLIANDYNNRVSGQGSYKGTSTISSVSIISTNGDLDSGTIYVYGA